MSKPYQGQREGQDRGSRMHPHLLIGGGQPEHPTLPPNFPSS